MVNLNKVLAQLETKGFKIHKISKIKGGENSNTYEILSNEEKYVLKIYIKNNINKINRCEREKKFLEFLNNVKIFNAPKSIISDPNMNWILLSWIEGKNINKINNSICKQLIGFLILIQSHRDKLDAKKLPLASEAFFTIKDHLNAIEKRHYYLLSLKKNIYKVDVSNLLKLEKLILNNLKKITYLKDFYINKKNLNFESEIKNENKIISVSDVGFHNVICKGNKAFFYDFEYAGWDDPYKLFSDLLLQPDQNLPLNFLNLLDEYVEKFIFINNFKNSRLLLMLELYRLKWSLIILNPIFKSTELDTYEFNFFVNNKLTKSFHYLEESSERIKNIKKRYF